MSFPLPAFIVADFERIQRESAELLRTRQLERMVDLVYHQDAQLLAPGQTRTAHTVIASAQPHNTSSSDGTL